MANSFLACFKYIEKEYVKTAWGLGKDGKVEPACKHCFSIPHFGMPAPGIPYDWSIVTVNVNIDVNRFALRERRVKQT